MGGNKLQVIFFFFLLTIGILGGIFGDKIDKAQKKMNGLDSSE